MCCMGTAHSCAEVLIQSISLLPLPCNFIAMRFHCHAISLPCDFIAMRFHCHAILLPYHANEVTMQIPMTKICRDTYNIPTTAGKVPNARSVVHCVGTMSLSMVPDEVLLEILVRIGYDCATHMSARLVCKRFIEMYTVSNRIGCDVIGTIYAPSTNPLMKDQGLIHDMMRYMYTGTTDPYLTCPSAVFVGTSNNILWNGGGGYICYHDSSSDTASRIAGTHGNGWFELAASRDGQYFASFGTDKCSVWKTPATRFCEERPILEVLTKDKPYDDLVQDICFVTEHRVVIAYSHSLAICDINTKQVTHINLDDILRDSYDTVEAVHHDEGGDRVVIRCHDAMYATHLTSLNSILLVHDDEMEFVTSCDSHAVCVGDTHGNSIVILSTDGDTTIVPKPSGDVVWGCKPYYYKLVALSSDNTKIAVVSESHVDILDIPTKSSIKRIEKIEGLWSISFSYDGTYLLMAGLYSIVVKKNII